MSYLIGLRYRSLKGYKYQLMDDIIVHINSPAVILETPYFKLDDGIMLIKKGYAWDGPSGLTIDTKTFMRGSLVHDAFYQAMRERKLDIGYRKLADEELRRICLEDGMNRFRAGYVFKCVRAFGGKHASKKPKDTTRLI